MAAKKNLISEAAFLKWIKEGRGSGQNEEYRPWLTVRDLPSLGRVHRVFGHKSRRTHHLLSDLELSVFLLLEWLPDVTQIREQFPLNRTLTKQLAADAGIKHPAQNGFDHFMSSDFLVDSSNEETPRFVFQAKYASALDDERTVEKLELERRYWVEKDVPWYLITDHQIPKEVSKNVNWLYPVGRSEEDDELASEQIEFYQHQFTQNPNQTIISLCKKLDTSYDLNAGESLYEVRRLLAKRYFEFDIFTPITKLKVGALRASDLGFIKEAYRVSNQ
ncbi:TnsA endonuclease C-terminal domain-containing protein [Idiomarina abyssalis]|uniref:TnsA endonuclease C-terminal domain-containing protein n=1 Tax=Idiomarina abyssalis TaxID=86102 RepID=UPI003A91784B